MLPFRFIFGLQEQEEKPMSSRAEWSPAKHQRSKAASQRIVTKSKRLRIEYNLEGQKQVLK